MSGNAPQRVDLGRTGLSVSRLCLASGYAREPGTVHAALDCGINFFCFGSLGRGEFGRSIASLPTSVRDDLVLAVQSYSRSASLLDNSLTRALRRTRTDRAEVIILGYWSSPVFESVMARAVRLREAGAVRAICISSHAPARIRMTYPDGAADIIMVRYSAADPDGTEEFLREAPAEGGPGVISFTSTYWGRLLDQRFMPRGETAPGAADCYRFALSHPRVDAVLCGAADPSQVREGAAALSGQSMTETESARMRRIGAHVAARHSPFFYGF